MQLDLFDVMYERFMFEQNKPIKALTLFSGIGFQEMGMDLAEIPYEMVGTSEIDKFAILSYAAVHTDYLKLRNDYNFPKKEVMVDHLQKRNIGINLKTWKQTITNSTNEETVKDFYLASILNKNFGDVSKLKGKDIESEIDLLTYSFPCTDLSKAGQQAGLSRDTRSGLVYEVLRLLYELKETDNLPKVLIMKNVIDLIQVKFVDEWNKIALEIEQMGYTNFTQELNGRDYGIAQNRRRVFMVSVLGEYNYVKPKPFKLEKRLKDYLEHVVDESYYLSEKMLKFFEENTRKNKEKGNGFKFSPTDGSDVAKTITTRSGSRMDDNFLVIPEATKAGFDKAYDGDGIYLNRPHQKRGVVQKGMIQTLKTSSNDVGVVVGRLPLRIRKLTPHETGRLMGMQDCQINKQAEVTSKGQMYKQHGNGIIAQVIGFIVGNMYYEDYETLKQIILKNSFTWLKKEEKWRTSGVKKTLRY